MRRLPPARIAGDALVQAQSFPPFEPVRVGFDEAGPPGVVPLPVGLELLDLENGLPASAVVSLS